MKLASDGKIQNYWKSNETCSPGAPTKETSKEVSCTLIPAILCFETATNLKYHYPIIFKSPTCLFLPINSKRLKILAQQHNN